MSDEDSKIDSESLELDIDKVSEDLFDEISENMPEVISDTFGVDPDDLFNEYKIKEGKSELVPIISDFLKGLKEAFNSETDLERSKKSIKVIDKYLKQIIEASDEEISHNFYGIDLLLEELRKLIKQYKVLAKERGYPEYFDIVNGFAKKVVFEKEKGMKMEEFYKNLEGHEVESISQRIYNPVIKKHSQYLNKKPKITNPEEARHYADIYYELTELSKKYLPIFMTSLEIAYGRKETYKKFKEMPLNNIVGMLGGRKFKEFNKLAKGIDVDLRNSIAHRDFKIKPSEEIIEFRNRGEIIGELSYAEFTERVFRLLTVFEAIVGFSIFVRYYLIRSRLDIYNFITERNKSIFYYSVR